MSENTLTLRLALLGATVVGYDSVPVNSALGNLAIIAPSPGSTSGFRMQARLAIAADKTICVAVNLKVGATVEVVAPAAQAHAGGRPVTNASYQRYPQCDPGCVVYAMLQNGVQPRNEMSANTLGDL